jgi:hypothetical protein
MERRNFMAGVAGIPLALGSLFGLTKAVGSDYENGISAEELPTPEPKDIKEYELPIDFGNGYTGSVEGVYVNNENKAQKVRGKFEDGWLTEVDFID